MNPIQMVDLKSQYLRIKPEIDAAIQRVLDSTAFIQGSPVFDFEQQLVQYAGSKCVVSCGNGTDALLAALMSLGIGEGDEVVVPAFTFIAAVEVIALLGATPVFVDVCEDSFNVDVSALEKAVTPKTKVILPVHLYGQCADMEPILKIAKKHNIKVIEDACQAVGTTYTFSDGTMKQAGTMGDVGCLSFFPSKNLGCYGDGGAMMTQDADLSERLRAICKHGSKEKYHHQLVGLNSRLDTLQVAILMAKLPHLDDFIAARGFAAQYYYEALKGLDWIELPVIKENTTHTFHQFTLKVKEGRRDALKQYLAEKGIPSMIYYPVPAHLQPAYQYLNYKEGDFPVAEQLCREVLSLPMHTELSENQLQYICKTIVDCPL
ncbi:MAG: DegT/DnrJ/EryC1/StrS family aminotransferase [Bacteroidales bacterium]|nr:DegT/DnrJ/EryC1/StrS family aminotransferase [Bacteroidales bacterium]